MGTWNYLFILVVYSISCSKVTNGWQTSPSQYHIQTDEGPERYFRYQTDSGQYRKEKRLEDGTVIGTYAWIDDNGFLRQRDYIADNAGYRILKSKNVFVGRGVPVGEAVKSVKKYPASAGTLVRQGTRRPVITDIPQKRPVITDIPSTYAPPTVPSSTYLPSVIPSTTTEQYLPPVISTTTENPLGYKPADTPFVQTSYLPAVQSTTISPIPSPYDVEISPNAAPSSTPLYPSSTPGYVEITQNAIASTTEGVPTETPQYISPIANNSVTETYYPSTLSPASVQYIPPSDSPIYNIQNQNSIDFNPYVSHQDNSYVFQNGPTYPIAKNGHTYNGRLGNGYDPQYPEYDGVSVTNDGFRYYIPRAYHEEQTSGDRRDGSFGYIDPFGIRRVIYYNTAPGTGFQHRKNNRYVGFDATPYDPRPY